MAKYARLEVLSQVNDQGLIPLSYHSNIDVMKKMITASYMGGCYLFEFTNRGDNAVWIFSELVRYFLDEIPDLILGAGSILDAGTASLYMSCGANFIVGSVFNPDVAKVCNRRKVAYMPGCGTANEISTAEEYGAEIVKIFPGEAVGGPAFVKSILGPTPWTKVMVTGGVEDNPDNISSWFKAGVTAVGMGSNLFKKKSIEDGKFDEISSTAASVLKWIRQARGEITNYSLEHIGIYPSNTATYEEITNWYAKTFNLTVKEGSSSNFLSGKGGGRFEIMKENRAERVHIAISVSDFEDAVAELKNKGIELDGSPKISQATKAVYLKDTDPAGNRIHLIWRKK